MPFGIIGRTGPGLRRVVGFADQSKARGTFGSQFGVRDCNQWGLYGVRVRQRRDAAPFPNYFWQTCCGCLQKASKTYRLPKFVVQFDNRIHASFKALSMKTGLRIDALERDSQLIKCSRCAFHRTAGKSHRSISMNFCTCINTVISAKIMSIYSAEF